MNAASRPGGKSTSVSWQWERTGQTQRSFLDGARKLFTAQGFAETSVADLVKESGSTVGSLYHHFGSKSDLYVALWESYVGALEEATRGAIVSARRDGVTEPLELLAAAGRAYLEVCWQERDLTTLFTTADGPTGFEVIRRQRGRAWISRNDALLQLSDNSFDHLYLVLVTTVIGEGGWEVANADNQQQAEPIIDGVIEYLYRIASGGVWRPPADEPRANPHGLTPFRTA